MNVIHCTSIFLSKRFKNSIETRTDSLNRNFSNTVKLEQVTFPFKSVYSDVGTASKDCSMHKKTIAL